MIDWSQPLTARAALYGARFPDWPAPRADGRWLDGVWVLGNNYRGAALYGSYPPGYLARVGAFFPEAVSTLHLFSGTLRKPQDASGRWVAVDARRTDVVRPTACAEAAKLPFGAGSFDLVIADPPYSVEDARRYGTGMPNRRLVFRELHRVVEPGGVVIWLDCSHPMTSKAQWHWFGVFGVVRSSNHRYRAATFWRRAA